MTEKERYQADCPNCGATVNCYKIGAIQACEDLDVEILKILSGPYWQEDLAAGNSQELVRAIKDLIQQRERMAWEQGCIDGWTAAKDTAEEQIPYSTANPGPSVFGVHLFRPTQSVSRFKTLQDFFDWKKEPQSFDPAQDEAEHLERIRREVEK